MEDFSSNSKRPEKPRIIRNREVDKAARALAEEHALPEAPGKILSWTQMFEYLALLTPDMWSHLTIYVYRLKPKIRRQLKDPNAPNYIDCFGEPFTPEYFIGRNGGGKFMFQAVDSDKKNKESGRELFQCFHTIDDVKYPPILDYSELELEAKENQSYITWLRNKGILDSKGNIVAEQNSSQANPTNGLAATKDVLEILKYVSQMNADQQNQLKARLAPEEDSIGKGVGQLLLEKMKQDDPTKQAEVWAKLVGSLKDIIGTSKSDNGISGIYDKLIEMQGEHNKTVMSLLDRVFQMQQKPPEPPRTALDDFDKIFALLDKARGWGGGGAKRNGWDIGYDIAKDIGLPFLQTFSQTLTGIMTLRRGQVTAPGAPGTPTMPASIDPYRDSAATAAYASTLRNQTPPTSPAQTAPTPSADAPPTTPTAHPAAPATTTGASEIFEQYGGLVLNAINNGTPGYAFADYVVGLMGQATHAMIANHSEDTLVTTMMTIPEFQIFGEPRIRQFVHQFIHFEEFQDDEEPIEPDEVDVSNVYRPRDHRQPGARS